MTLRRRERRHEASEGGALDNDAGVASLELALLAVVFVLMLMLAAYAWRVAQAAATVSDAAAEAARAVSLPSATTADAEAVAQQSLVEAGTSCESLNVSVTDGATTTSSTTAETVSVRIECTVPLGDLAPIGVPGSQQINADHTEIVDVYRGGR